MNLKTIAKMAGVSTVTVSNVMNGKYNKASKETVERILKIIEETNYQPSATARSLIMKQSRIIGVMIPNIHEDESYSSSPYYTQMLGFLDRYIREQGYYMMLRCVVQSSDVLPDFATWNVDGAFLLGVVAEDAMMLREKLDIPAVFIDTYADGLPLATVGVEDYRGGALMAEYLIHMGHRRIALATTPVEYTGVIQERYRGFLDTVRLMGGEFNDPDLFVTVNVLYEDGINVGHRIAQAGGYSAVAAMSDVMALGIMEGLRDCGLRVPEDVSVIGFDDLPECLYSHPKLTSISQNIREKAEIAGEYLFSMLRTGRQETGCRRVDVALAERQSVVRFGNNM